MATEGSFVMSKYWDFDLDSYLYDYPINKEVLSTLKILLRSYQSYIQNSEDCSFHNSFEYKMQVKMLSEKIVKYQNYFSVFDNQLNQLSSMERDLVECFFFGKYESAEEAEKELSSKYGLSRSAIYCKRSNAMEKIKGGVFRQDVFILKNYWRFDRNLFLKDFQDNEEILDAKREQMCEFDECELPCKNPDIPNVQVTIDECLMLNMLVRKKILSSEIKAYETYETLFKIVWNLLSDEERNTVDTFFYGDYPTQEAAKIALMEMYNYSQSAIYAIRRDALKKVERCLNG